MRIIRVFNSSGKIEYLAKSLTFEIIYQYLKSI